MQNFQQQSQQLDEAGFRLEWVNGLATVEASPVFRHQTAVRRIENSIRPQASDDAICQCVAASNVSIRFPDGSHKRPDIAIWCREPDEQDTEVTLLPEAVVEILSKGYEAKDLVIGVPFYQRVGISDILVFDPETNIVRHWRNGGNEKSYPSPVTLDLLCGCTITL